MTFDGYRDFTWDAESRLLSVETRSDLVPAGGTEYRIQYAYDYMGRRIQQSSYRKVGNQWYLNHQRRFVHDGWNIVAELAGDTVTQTLDRSYLWGPDISGTSNGAGGVGGLLAIEKYHGSDAGVHFVSHDGNGNVVALTNAADGTLSASYEYDAFGNLLEMSGVFAPQNLYRFSSKRIDEFTGLYDYGFRTYDPVAGRWLSRDPIAEGGGLNLYAFVGNDGVNQVDVLGSSPFSAVGDWLQEYFLQGPDSVAESRVQISDDTSVIQIDTGDSVPLTVVEGSSGGYFLLGKDGCYREVEGDVLTAIIQGDLDVRAIANADRPILLEEQRKQEKFDIVYNSFVGQGENPNLLDYVSITFFHGFDGLGTVQLYESFYRKDLYSQQSLTMGQAMWRAFQGGTALASSATGVSGGLGVFAKGFKLPGPRIAPRNTENLFSYTRHSGGFSGDTFKVGAAGRAWATKHAPGPWAFDEGVKNAFTRAWRTGQFTRFNYVKKIPVAARSLFSPVRAFGPTRGWKRLGGQYFTRTSGNVNLATGQVLSPTLWQRARFVGDATIYHGVDITATGSIIGLGGYGIYIWFSDE